MKVQLYRLVDKWVGIPLCVIAGGLSRIFPKSRRTPKRIAVLKLWAIGDSIISLPMMRTLRKNFTNAKIDVITRKRNSAVFENNKDINKIVLFELNNLPKILSLFKKYDLVIDSEPWMRLSALLSLFAGRRRIGFGGQARSLVYTDTIAFNKKQHMVMNYLEMARVAGAKKIEPFPVSLESSSADKKAVEKFIKENGLANKKLFGFCPGGVVAAPTRLWPPERFAELADRLVEKYKASIVFVGGPSDSAIIEKIRSLMKGKTREKSASAAGKISLKQLFYISKKFRLFVSNDTGPMHIAAAQGAPTVGLFGASNPVLWAPYGKKTAVVYKKLSCSPCNISQKGAAPDCLRKKDRYLCMRLITVQDVLKAVKKLL